VIVELASNFHYSHLNFKVSIFDEFNDCWHCIINIFFLFDHVEILKANCHKRMRVVQVRNLFLEFKVPVIFHAMLIYFSKKNYLILFLDEKMQKISQETQFGYINASDLRFYSIGLKFEPQTHKAFY